MNYQSQEINELATALAKAQGEISGASKDNTNPHFRSKYADLHSVWNACREPLTKNGLAVIQTMSEENGRVILNTMLTHSSGQWIRSSVPVVTSKNDAQGYGSALTYFRRYSLSALVGVAPNDDSDDDGNSACIPDKKPKGQPIEQQKRPIEQQKTPIEQQKLSEAQVGTIKDILENDKVQEKKILDFYGVKSLSDLPASEFKKVFQSCFKRKEERSRENEFRNVAEA